MNELRSMIEGSATGISSGNLMELLLMLLASMAYGMLIQGIYHIYFRRNEPVDASIARSFAIIAPGVTSIFWLIQYSLPLSLGLLGALSFVRFRTPVKRAEDIAFILTIIAISLGCAVQKLWMGLVIVAVLLVYTVLRNSVLPKLGMKGRMVLVTLHTRDNIASKVLLEMLSRTTGGAARVVSSSIHDSIQSVVAQLPSSNQELVEKVREALYAIDERARFDVFYPDSQYGDY